MKLPVIELNSLRSNEARATVVLSMDDNPGNDCAMRCVLIEVNDAGEAINSDLQADIGLIAELAGCEPEELSQIEIDGRFYVPVITPYAQ